MNLREIPIFKNLSDEEIREIEKSTSIEEKIFPKASHIFKEGDIKDDFYYLIQGSVKVYKVDPEGKRYIIASFTKPAIFGEVYAYLKEPFDFWAEADKESKILVISDFRGLMAKIQSRTLLLNFTDLLARKSLTLSKKNQINSKTSLKQKIAAYLIENEKEGMVHLETSREEWADYLATTRPSLSRSLSEMAKDGIIKVNNKEIQIPDIETLKNLI